ncbi:hypothetical protein CspHIS471_0313170 [Cutaneotrichosporon sp. HIS471]|nr:hypothetical protein CspHIS471_0313170 [Cutaneotrichosporon sp. HIS471]
MASSHERLEDLQSASSASASPLGTSGELITLSDAESVDKPYSHHSQADDRTGSAKMFDVDPPPPAPDFYHRFPAAPASTPLDEEAEKAAEMSFAPVSLEHDHSALNDRLPRIPSGPASAFPELHVEMDAETRRYIVQHGARSAFNPGHRPPPPTRSSTRTPGPALVAVAGAEYDFPNESDAVSATEVPPMPLPSQRLPSIQLDAEALAREQRAYIIEQGVRSGFDVNVPVPFVLPIPDTHVTKTSHSILDAHEKGVTDAQEGEIEKDHAPDACDQPASGDVGHTLDVTVEEGHYHMPSTSKLEDRTALLTTTNNMNNDATQAQAVDHQHFPLTNIEPGSTADTTERLESVEAKDVVAERAGANKPVVQADEPHQHFLLTNIEPDLTADLTRRLESVEAKVVDGPQPRAAAAAAHTAAPPHQHFALTNVEPGPTSDTTRRLESVEAKQVEGTKDHEPVILTHVERKPDPLGMADREVDMTSHLQGLAVDPIHAITGEETPKAVIQATKNPIDNLMSKEHGEDLTVAITKTHPESPHMWWDGNLPRRTALATLLGAIAYGMYKASLECPQREALNLACAWFAVAAVNSLQPGKKLVGTKNWTDLTLDTSAKVLAAALLATVFK